MRDEKGNLQLLPDENELMKPKKPLTPYMLFVREVRFLLCLILKTRPKVVASHPNIPPLDVMKEVGRLWQVITKEHLQKF